jgi:hypothetical protein
MLCCTSRRASPSTLIEASIASRMALMSASDSSSTLRDSGMFAFLQIVFAVEGPMP